MVPHPARAGSSDRARAPAPRGHWEKLPELLGREPWDGGMGGTLLTAVSFSLGEPLGAPKLILT